MRFLDYFWLQDRNQIYIVRCLLDTGEVVGRVSYISCKKGNISLAGRSYKKVRLDRSIDLPIFKTICDLPGDTCLAVPKSAIKGILDPREEFPRVRKYISSRVNKFLDKLLKETNLQEKDIAIIGSQIFRVNAGSSIGDIDVVIYGEKHIDVVRDVIQSLLSRGIVMKLPLDQDRNDQARMKFFGISPSGMERIRASQWFRKLLCSEFLITLCFAPDDTYEISLKLIECDTELTGQITQNHNSYYPPYSYHIVTDLSTDVKCCATFAWCFRHAFAIGERIIARGTVAEINGKKCIWVWKSGHYLRPF